MTMHFLTLAAVHLPEMTDEAENDNALEFSAAVSSALWELLDRYNEVTENPKYLEFYDETEALKQEYEEGAVDCMKLPQGRIIITPSNYYQFRFVIREGQVFETLRGPMKQEKRTKRAKRIVALPEYPWKKLYPDFKAFADSWGHIDYIEEYGAYGYLVNPEGRWAGCSLGGRWPFLLLVKDTCAEYCEGRKSWGYDGYEPKTPEGYIWTSAARKKDIEWQAMRDWQNKQREESFARLERYFLTGECDKEIHGVRTEDGISFGGEYLYHKDETFEDYAARNHFRACAYPIDANSLCDDKGWKSVDEWEWKRNVAGDVAEAWEKEVEDFLDSMPDEDVLAIMDCHI